MEPAQARNAALAFLKSHNAGVLATVTREGVPHASVVHYIADESFSLYFLTLRSSRKYRALLQNPRVAFVVGTQDIPQTLQIEGMAEELRSEEELGARMPGLLGTLSSNSRYYAPLTKLDAEDTAAVWVQAKWVRWGDFASPEFGTRSNLVEIPLG